MRPILAEAVEQARRALLDLEPAGVGPHLGVTAEDEASATHHFEATLPGYRGWQWAVVVAAPPEADHVTISESALLPGPDALVAPEFIPWDQRVRPGDLAPGDLLAPRPDDPRLVPGYLATGDPAVDEVALELGLGRPQVLSREGRIEAADRWFAEFGPETEMARAAPSTCGLCGFFVPLAGALRSAFGVCANAMGADGRVVHTEYGCGAHSDTVLPTGGGSPIYEAYDDAAIDLIPASEYRRIEDSANAPAAEADSAGTEADSAPAADTTAGADSAIAAESSADTVETATATSTPPTGETAAVDTEIRSATDSPAEVDSAPADDTTAEADSRTTETTVAPADSNPGIEASAQAAPAAEPVGATANPAEAGTTVTPSANESPAAVTEPQPATGPAADADSASVAESSAATVETATPEADSAAVEATATAAEPNAEASDRLAPAVEPTAATGTAEPTANPGAAEASTTATDETTSATEETSSATGETESAHTETRPATGAPTAATPVAEPVTNPADAHAKSTSPAEETREITLFDVDPDAGSYDDAWGVASVRVERQPGDPGTSELN
ncbi:DUF3027 domain-containing protein [Nocardia uniformis]|uniref:DUF3027 domain-containing protein n=1 Tax=Nocardia uniformis TaxID=53432 RepID=A0A849BYQ3_9NOCA|nr:DUF3027 domain-containing protein [Nocardia uniformis]